MTTLPTLEIMDLLEVNETGWGPRAPEATDGIVDGVPFQQYNKADRVGRVADWPGGDRFYRRGNERYYNERVYGSAANAGSHFHYVHGLDESSFQQVDTSKPVQRSAPQRNFRYRLLMNKKILQKELERKEQASQGQTVKLKRSIAKEQQRAYKMWQRRGGNARQGQRSGTGRWQNDRPKERQPSVIVEKDWTILEEFDFPRLSKLNLPNIGAGEEIGNHQYGTLHYYDKLMDRISVKTSMPLKKCGGTFFNGSTTEDPVIQVLASEGIGNVFATDTILATLMSSSKSVYSWDIVAERVGDLLFLDKRTEGICNPVDALTVSETSSEPPVWEGNGINNAKDLATEALYINQNFRRQVLRRTDPGYKLTNPSMPFDDEVEDIECAYKYRKFSLGKGVDVVCRTEHDGAYMAPTGETQLLTIKAFNEWDSSQSGGVDWRSRLTAQKGAVLVTEIQNNQCKMAKWTIQALLANSDLIKFGYVSRLNPRTSAQHTILSTQEARPQMFAQSISLNMDNSWGILRCIIDSLMRQPVGKYLLLKDPVSPVVRLFSIPDSAFDGDKQDSANTEDVDDEY